MSQKHIRVGWAYKQCFLRQNISRIVPLQVHITLKIKPCPIFIYTPVPTKLYKNCLMFKVFVICTLHLNKYTFS